MTRVNLLDEEKSIKNKSLTRRVSESYFKIRSFEKSGRLYESLGVKLFSKYNPIWGSHWISKGQDSRLKGRKKEDIKYLISQLKSVEVGHIICLIPAELPALAYLSQDSRSGFLVFTALNIFMNIYSVIGQRYNRNRAEKILEWYESKER